MSEIPKSVWLIIDRFGELQPHWLYTPREAKEVATKHTAQDLHAGPYLPVRYVLADPGRAKLEVAVLERVIYAAPLLKCDMDRLRELLNRLEREAEAEDV